MFQNQEPDEIPRAFRNLEIHLYSATLKSAKKNATFAGKDIVMEIWVADDITEAEFKQLKGSRFYTDQEITKMVAWFNAAQKEWGIVDLIYRAVVEYCTTLISKYGL